MSKKSIAIMGAGLSGLACAFELEKYGFTPEIFDDRREVEDRFINMEGMMDMLTKPISDCFAHLADNYNLYLTPQNPIKRMDLCSESHRTFIEGQLGFFTVRGRHPNALGKQMEDKVKSQIHFNSKKDHHTLAREYDIIVLATRDGHQTRQLQKYKNDVSVKIKGATLHGSFDPTCVKIILNNHFAPKGYTYLLHYDEKKPIWLSPLL